MVFQEKINQAWGGNGMSFLDRLFGSNNGNAENQADASSGESAAAMQEPEAETDAEVVAVIMAAILSTMEPGSSNGLRIRSIRRVGTNAPTWCIAGRQTYISSKL